MKQARELKKLIQTLSKRSDFNIQFVDLHPKVDSNILKSYKGIIPDDLFSFYKVMNGCSFFAQHTFEENLFIGINIPKIEYLRSFELPSTTDYNFNDDDIKILPFEWIESTSCTFFIIYQMMKMM